MVKAIAVVLSSLTFCVAMEVILGLALTRVAVLTVLFAVFRSVVEEAICVRFVTLPAVLGVPLIVIATEPPLTIEPIVKVRTLPLIPHVPWLVLTAATPKLAGNVFVTNTLDAL